MRLIDGDALYAKLQEYEELARKRVWDTASTLPFPTNLNPSYTRYLAQLDERTALKHMVADAPTIEQPEIIRCRECCYWIPGLITDNDCFIPPKCGKYQRGKYQQMVGHSADDYCSYAERREEKDGSIN